MKLGRIIPPSKIRLLTLVKGGPDMVGPVERAFNERWQESAREVARAQLRARPTRYNGYRLWVVK